MKGSKQFPNYYLRISKTMNRQALGKKNVFINFQKPAASLRYLLQQTVCPVWRQKREISTVSIMTSM